MIKWLRCFFASALRNLALSAQEHELRIKDLEEYDIRRQWEKETGRRFNDIIGRYAISEDELAAIAESVGEYVTQTRITNIDKLLFYDGDKSRPRHPNSIRKGTTRSD